MGCRSRRALTPSVVFANQEMENLDGHQFRKLGVRLGRIVHPPHTFGANAFEQAVATQIAMRRFARGGCSAFFERIKLRVNQVWFWR